MTTHLFNRKTNTVVALLLAVTMLLGALFVNMTVPVLSADVENTTYITLEGDRVHNITLEDDAKFRLETVSDAKVSSYQWQIKDPAQTDRWISISGGLSKYLWVTHALVGSMLAFDGTAQLRCRVGTESGEVYTDPVVISVSLKVTSPIFNAEPSKNSQTVNVRDVDGEHKTYSIIINYLFDNNAIAFEPYGATVAAGSNFITGDKPIESPKVVGYSPFRRVGDSYVDASIIEFELYNIQADVVINVIYEPALVEFSIHHHLQNILDDQYTVTADMITKGHALTGSVVGNGLAKTEEELPGFKALDYEKLTVAADGSTVIEIRYDRNYYLVDFDMNGGYGTEPVYTRYGATVGANNPIRHGYVFDGWELVSYGGQTPTTEQKSMYSLQTGGTILVPAANLRYKARWITQDTTYTMVFWCENANDNGYSYWGCLEGLVAKSGTYVDGAHRISEVAGIEDEQYFTFNPNKTDKHVLVEGDGSTVVNVYYTRNYYKIDFKAPGKCTIIPDHSHGDECYDIICDIIGHRHSEQCVPILTCSIPEHTEHTEECIACGFEEHIHGSIGCNCTLTQHTHTTECWENISYRQNSVSGAPKNPSLGEIYYRKIFRTYYIYLFGSWYTYTGKNVSTGDIVDPSCGMEDHEHGSDCACEKTEHTHSEDCYGDDLHTHTSTCYKYSCGETEHSHDSTCKRLKCGNPEDHSHSGYNSTCNNANSTNVVKTVYAKYGQSIKNIWPIADGNGKLYNQGQRWKPGTDSAYYDEVLVYISKMPPDDFTLTLDNGSSTNKDFTMYYYLQVLPGQNYDVEYYGKYYAEDNIIKAKYGYLTKAEDFFDIEGFVQYASNPAFDRNNQISSNTTVKFYYDRITDHNLEFKNMDEVMDDKKVYGIMYGASLKGYDFEPEYPSTLEPNAYTFDGWYTSPGCFPGTEVDWDKLTMPVGDLMLYAKWKPITHTVRVFKDATLTEQIGEPQTVDHKAFANAPVGNVTNGNYVFQGWFYKDEVNGVITEKAFVFNGIPVLDDMDIYAKWSSHVSVNYKINYKLFNTDTNIADPTEGSAIAGHNKTFDAKAGDQLYAGYQTGFYPLTNSHTITMSVDGTLEFTFYYVYVPSMPYKVQYINKATGEKMTEQDKVVMDNTFSVVTETFVRFEKMMPDAYQKRLVLSADNTDSDGDGIYDANVITFYYSSDEKHAYYRVVHYIQNIKRDGYREYRSEETVGIIGQTYTVSSLTLTGFKYEPTKTVIDSEVTPSTGTTVSTVLNGDGALIELYYDREIYDYTVKYIDGFSGKVLADDKVSSGVFGEQIIEYALNLESKGYKLVGENDAKTITISANDDLNVIEFLYQEMTVALKYQIVGPSGCGVLTQYSENLTSFSGRPNGSEPIVNKGFAFIGWYKDIDCTIPVDSQWVNQNNHIQPVKQGEIWTPATYYAKFIALETDLTITTKSTAAVDTNQVFIFNIKGKAGTDTERINITVTVVGNNSVTVAKLPTGDYTVTELTDWSWRYENSTAIREVKLDYSESGNEIIFDNSRENGKWLDGNDVKNNKF